jgi:hypothetical protein
MSSITKKQPVYYSIYPFATANPLSFSISYDPCIWNRSLTSNICINIVPCWYGRHLLQIRLYCLDPTKPVTTPGRIQVAAFQF